MRTVKEIQEQIKTLKQEIETVQENCKHENYEISYYISQGGGRSGHFRVCLICDKIIEKASDEERFEYDFYGREGRWKHSVINPDYGLFERNGLYNHAMEFLQYLSWNKEVINEQLKTNKLLQDHVYNFIQVINENKDKQNGVNCYCKSGELFNFKNAKEFPVLFEYLKKIEV